jgi:hypothetical protein
MKDNGTSADLYEELTAAAGAPVTIRTAARILSRNSAQKLAEVGLEELILDGSFA